MSDSCLKQHKDKPNTFTALYIRQTTPSSDNIADFGLLIKIGHERLVTTLQYSKKYLKMNIIIINSGRKNKRVTPIHGSIHGYKFLEILVNNLNTVDGICSMISIKDLKGHQ